MEVLLTNQISGTQNPSLPHWNYLTPRNYSKAAQGPSKGVTVFAVHIGTVINIPKCFWEKIRCKKYSQKLKHKKAYSILHHDTWSYPRINLVYVWVSIYGKIKNITTYIIKFIRKINVWLQLELILWPFNRCVLSLSILRGFLWLCWPSRRNIRQKWSGEFGTRKEVASLCHR